MQQAPGMEVVGPWDEMALRKVEEWDPTWAEASKKMSSNPWKNGVLSRKLIELICIGLNAACANLNADGIRRHIRAALDAGATRDEILFVLKCATVTAVHSSTMEVLEAVKETTIPQMDQLNEANRERLKKAGGVTPAVDKLKAIGQWKAEWEPMLIADPIWTDEFLSTELFIYNSGVLSAKDIELLRVAFDTLSANTNSARVQRHIKNAMIAGATISEIMDVLKLCIARGVATCNLAVPILAQEMTKQGK
jgi:alkylhydroperoxidase/carboxymuconolactone decarboxylase family protein YurZ